MSLASSVSATAFNAIPIIDLSQANGSNDQRKALALQIQKACIDVGFFYIENHGIPQPIIINILSAIQAYFALPLETKMKLHHKTTPNFKGYSPLLDANIDPAAGTQGDLHEGFELGWERLDSNADSKRKNDGVMTGSNLWPDEPAGFREAMLGYYHAAIAVGEVLFPLFALALELPERYFDDKTKNSAAIMRTIHYPPQNNPKDVGIGAHTDFECFTILYQQSNVQALQVLNADKKWINAPPIDGTLVINIGDQLARWTNDVFKSTVHRAINVPGVERYSIPLFFGTDYDVDIQPIPSCVSTERPAKYEAITAGEYVKQRLEAMYNH
ncbi:2OG-Fe(II) oxygenase [Hygrophoropsis aurantiaca]|uniref:2OG-Fe(II) oxygenase n=1 Tax=Hygrophoropsis aurantiaca TaxID=72124 RepID=A0ACB8AAD8_9AGAM|nr:2OG-Fe(II) oxygenase [Hygrophoropsis aurantiaca]